MCETKCVHYSALSSFTSCTALKGLKAASLQQDAPLVSPLCDDLSGCRSAKHAAVGPVRKVSEGGTVITELLCFRQTLINSCCCFVPTLGSNGSHGCSVEIRAIIIEAIYCIL